VTSFLAQYLELPLTKGSAHGICQNFLIHLLAFALLVAQARADEQVSLPDQAFCNGRTGVFYSYLKTHLAKAPKYIDESANADGFQFFFDPTIIDNSNPPRIRFSGAKQASCHVPRGLMKFSPAKEPLDETCCIIANLS
jgi:hypothetical protein